ncbi:MAG TPA: ATP-dependent helicase HrpB [Acidiphilium sp.]|nr:MAG: ATP-dependent helicase HrpB [Acidiphilium sp. 21-60-14]OYV91130.1 MAG: ATP-dependent helicase HrpB [Acidiphilium sp. 37-60-79]HQT87003.1 ATP-dependent helicase HrpB [Acidiphilium sp.]HQU22950.1 ATP-dependent helicase HrpB [Acidiphilium sp.]
MDVFSSLDPRIIALPVRAVLVDLCAALRERPNAVLVAPPGAGKTTLAPLVLHREPWVGDQRIVMLEPRRLAARAAAHRMAALCGEAPGGLIGYSTRLERVVSARTRIEIITEGLLTARLLDDPGLEGVACVIFDEIHERSLEADLALALVLDLQRQLRPQLRILAMSATADTPRLAALLEAAVIVSDGFSHPVELIHEPRDLAVLRDLPTAMARAVRGAVSGYQGDILAFLPGIGEIRRTQEQLAGISAEIVPLYGDLPAEQQVRVLTPGVGRRVILATSIAETSLTLPGVRVVIDGGFRRAPEFDPGSALTRLVTRRISRAAAQQRAGRAGREAPGVAIRLWTASLQRGLAEFDRPEILDAELSRLVLACAAWGTQPDALAFIDAPPSGALTAARTLLTELGALQAATITSLGRRMAALGAAPRLAAMMLAAAGEEQALAADIAALLEERDPLRHQNSADIALRLEALRDRRAGDDAVIGRIRQAAAQYRARLGLRRDSPAAGDPAGLIAVAFPDRVAARRGEPGRFRLAGGGGAVLEPDDRLARAPLLAIAAMGGRGAAKISMAAPIDPENLPDILQDRLVRTRETALDPVAGTVLTRERVRLGALVLADRAERASAAETEAALRAAVLAKPERLDWSAALAQLQARLALLRVIEPERWPDYSTEALHATLAEWLFPHLAGLRSLREVAALDLAMILRDRLAYQDARDLAALVPERMVLPGGEVMIDYTAPVPLLAARAHFFYGLDATPSLAGGKIPLQCALLSPAGRPIAVTGDLSAFWRGGWLEARKDMRGRYPKHVWPEQPWLAAPRPR